jgi:cell filamentation protein
MSDGHYYIAGYSAEDDPYSESNGVLKNKLGITNTQDLNEIEADLASLAIQELLQRTPPAAFSVAHLRSIHKEIFHEIYPWACEFRQVDIAKGDTHFVRHQDIAIGWMRCLMTARPRAASAGCLPKHLRRRVQAF